jgi:N-acetylglutamate synthase-like GNAT family acetyltransferase
MHKIQSTTAEKQVKPGKTPFGASQLPLHENVAIANMKDLPAVMKLIAKGAREGGLLPRSECEVAADIKLGGGFVYRHGSGLAGMTFLSVYSTALAEIRSFYVGSDHRGDGKGKALIGSALSTAQNLGIKEVLAITAQDNEAFFAKCGFGQRSGFQTALFRKNGASQERPGEGLENATLHDLARLRSLMDEGENEGKLIPRSSAEVLSDMRDGNAFVYREYAGGDVTGMAFLSVYSKRLAELRNLYAVVERAESALVGSVAARADELGINETMVISKNGNGSVFAGHGFRQELHGFRIAMFRELGSQ